MHYMKEEWELLKHPSIAPGYLISSHGRVSIRGDGFNYPPIDSMYHSSNGYDYFPFITMKCGVPSLPVLYPIDELVALTFIRVPKELRNGKPVKITHINGDTRDNHSWNLKWEEDIEEWVDPICPIIRKDGTRLDIVKGRYKVSSFGRFYSLLTHNELHPWLDGGYYKISLVYTDGVNIVGDKSSKFHRLMAMSFGIPGHSEEHNMINHIDGNRSNSSLKNLEWVSNQQNVRHAFDVMLEINPSGEEHSRSKYTDNQRQCIYEIIETLNDIQPSHLTGLISRRLPTISRNDVKGFKQLLRQTGVEFPDLSDKWKNPQKFSEEEWLELEARVDAIFDKYGIYQMEVYENEHRKTV